MILTAWPNALVAGRLGPGITAYGGGPAAASAALAAFWPKGDASGRGWRRAGRARRGRGVGVGPKGEGGRAGGRGGGAGRGGRRGARVASAGRESRRAPAASGGRDGAGPSPFFFQAEDGIRDGRVTGVQTCALPI